VSPSQSSLGDKSDIRETTIDLMLGRSSGLSFVHSLPSCAIYNSNIHHLKLCPIYKI